MPGGGKKGGAQRIPPFDAADRSSVIDPLISTLTGSSGGGGGGGGQTFPSPYGGGGGGGGQKTVHGLTFPSPYGGGGGGGGGGTTGTLPGVNVGDIQNQIRSRDPLEQNAAGVLQGAQGGQSFLQGGQGVLGKAGGLFNLAQQAATAGSADILNDPNTQALLGAQENRFQSFLNQNLGEIGASAQRASGGVGSGSGETAAKTRATTQAGTALANQQAQTIQGLQQQQLRRAGILGELGGGLGNIGLSQAGLGSQLLGQQIGLGGQFQGRGSAAELFPLEQIFRLGELLKSTSGVRQPGFLEQLTSLGTAAGSIGSGFGLNQ